ncbi:MAG: aminoacyl-tRNA hydrolase [Methylovulum sp.]|nr:aminoacyl-tRNA hydrolase [Methylovulum sp.]
MIRLLVGLGNPGKQYDKTRHNAGFLFLDRLIVDYQEDWTDHARFFGATSVININNRDVRLLKPMTYMNESGRSVAAVVKYFNMSLDEVLVVHDDLDLRVGEWKVKYSGGHGGHNGVRSMHACLGGADFHRMRLGIGRPLAGKSVADYVLSQSSSDEYEKIQEAIGSSIAQVKSII